MEGLVTLLEANRPTVQSAAGQTYLCYLRGRIRRDAGRIMVGDRVEFAPTDPGQAMITRVLPRKNVLVRPPIANVGGLFAVFSLSQPKGSRELLDKRLVLAGLSGVAAEVVISKVDLLDSLAEAERLGDVYRRAGYPVWLVSAHNGEGIAAWTAAPRVGVWVLTGESGVGKSSLLQRLLPDQEIATGELGRGGRGQQTTRWVRLFRVADFWLADAPGYTALTATVDRVEDLLAGFPEWREATCRFPDCRHLQEPDCGVKEGVATGRFDPVRYRHYVLLTETWVKRWT